MTGFADSDGSVRSRAASARSDHRDAVDTLPEALGPGWSTSSAGVGGWSWAWFRRSDVMLPPQGWKLHISASPESAATLVRDVLPVLGGRAVWFKLPGDLAGVIALASGAAGATQLGKVVTVYPADDAEFRSVVELLDEAWRPARAPVAPYDLLVGTGGALSMRYGVFQRADVIVDPAGRPHSAVLSTSGLLEPDRRESTPDWAPDPPLEPRERDTAAPGRIFHVVGRRYAAVRPISSRAGAAVYASFDTESLDVVLVRVATSGVGADELGHDAVARLDNEARVLRHLSGAFGAPEVLGHDPESHLLVTRDVGGRTLEHLDLDQGLTALVSAAEQLDGLHGLGVVHGDVKPANVVFDGSRAHLVDFELATVAGDLDQIIGGSAGYTPPGGEYADADTAADLHALGGCLTYAVLGSCPGRLPRSENRERQLSLLRLYGHHTAESLVKRLTQPDAAARPTAGEAAALLREAGPAMMRESSEPVQSPHLDPTWAAEAARSAGLATRAFLVPNEHGHHWRNAHHFAAYTLQGINLGAAGIVLGLSTLDETLGSDEFEADVMGGARWLASRPPYPQAQGLFTGNAGVAVALAVAARRHVQPDLLVAARERFVAAATTSHPSSDLFSGAAGVVMAAISLAEILDEEWPLNLVTEQVSRLHASAHVAGELLGWPDAAPGVDPDTTYFGAAHGAAGVALALASWGRRRDAPESTTLALETYSRLYERARENDGDFLADSTGRVSPVQIWCHGLTGLSWCLEQVPDHPTALDEARRWAADRVLEAAPALGDPTLCHGTSGSLEVYRLLGSTPRAEETVEVLRVTRQSLPWGEVWSSEDPTTITPDLWVGFLGPATQLALLSQGITEPVLSPVWLKRCSGQPPEA